MRPYLRELGQHLRTQQEYGKEQKLKIADYENYIEKWAHEIKKPLSLMTLLLDNRKGEMSPLVHTRMLYVRDYSGICFLYSARLHFAIGRILLLQKFF